MSETENKVPIFFFLEVEGFEIMFIGIST